MSHKIFCDFCEAEIIHMVTHIRTTAAIPSIRSLPRSINIDINLTTDKSRATFTGDICRDCIWDAIDRVDPRDITKIPDNDNAP